MFSLETGKIIDYLDSIEKSHQSINRKVEQGQLPADTGQEADQLRRELGKYLIKRNADIQILVLDIRKGTEVESTEAIQMLSLVFAEIEQTKMHYFKIFTDLESKQQSDTPITVPESEKLKSLSPSDNKATQFLDLWEKKSTTEDLDIVIEIEPENVNLGESE